MSEPIYSFDSINAEIVTYFLWRFCPVIIYQDSDTELYWGELPINMIRDQAGHKTIEVFGPCGAVESAMGQAKILLDLELAKSKENSPTEIVQFFGDFE